MTPNFKTKQAFLTNTVHECQCRRLIRVPSCWNTPSVAFRGASVTRASSLHFLPSLFRKCVIDVLSPRKRPPQITKAAIVARIASQPKNSRRAQDNKPFRNVFPFLPSRTLIMLHESRGVKIPAWIRIWRRIFSFLMILDLDLDPVESGIVQPLQERRN